MVDETPTLAIVDYNAFGHMQLDLGMFELEPQVHDWQMFQLLFELWILVS
jgi:hypothetical protein